VPLPPPRAPLPPQPEGPGRTAPAASRPASEGVSGRLPGELRGEAVDLIELPGGTFLMGGETYYDERPVHPVQLQPFAMMRVPVTERLYRAVSGRSPPPPEEALLPVAGVSWFEAVTFCNELSERTGLRPCYEIGEQGVRWDRGTEGYRLPTEAEWEYAARAGTGGEYFFGDDAAPLGEYAWFAENSSTQRHPVGEKRSNPFGLLDIYGNVREWCWDVYNKYSEGSDKIVSVDPVGPPSGVDRVVRGGAFTGGPTGLRSAYRSWLEPERRFYNLGFRCVRSRGLR
jgi:formylglycine-generating enzyme required for sulfatase activity